MAEAKKNDVGDVGDVEVCPNLPNMDNLSQEKINTHFKNPDIIYLFDRKCKKSENESYNKWREHLFVHIFNLEVGDIHKLKEANELWGIVWTNIRNMEKNMQKYEELININGTPKDGIEIIETKLILQAGQGNYDFDYLVKFKEGEPRIYHYEYKHHTPDKLPQLLSLYDCKNPIVGEPIKEGKYKGKFKTKYLCLKQSYGDDNIFEFWKGNPYWLYYFNKYLNVKLKKKAEEEEKEEVLPVITENDYFCFVKSTDGIPFRTSKDEITSIIKDLNSINTLEDLNSIELPAEQKEKTMIEKWKVKEGKKWKKWKKYSKAKKYTGKEEYKVLNFFHILYAYKDKDWFKKITKESQIKYLQDFIDDETAKNSLCERLFENIRIREAGKRFIFYYGNNKWKMSTPYPESFENPIEEKVSLEGDEECGGESKSSVVVAPEDNSQSNIVRVDTGKKGDKTRLVITTKSGNRLDFNLRWANSIGIQNTAWQMNIYKGLTGCKKLLPEIVDKEYWAERQKDVEAEVEAEPTAPEVAGAEEKAGAEAKAGGGAKKMKRQKKRSSLKKDKPKKGGKRKKTRKKKSKKNKSKK